MAITDGITTKIRTRLAAREWEVDSLIDTFDQLQATYPDVLTNVYRTRAALAPLIHEGLLESVQGVGTYVRRIPTLRAADVAAQRDIAFLDGLLDELESLRRQVAAYREHLAERVA
ncbi:MAG: hypothetical protein ACTHMS_03185 [Jatrophihabitans sp.]|uniref:hypothetical protein n=1 Tax=Jatrophihabitans sp. TaxID=1932789 RepID=UPI003F820B28